MVHTKCLRKLTELGAAHKRLWEGSFSFDEIEVERGCGGSEQVGVVVKCMMGHQLWCFPQAIITVIFGSSTTNGAGLSLRV